MELIELIWSENTLSGHVIILLIFSLLIVSVAAAVAHIRRYARYETFQLDRVAGKLSRMLEQEAAGDEAAEEGEAETGWEGEAERRPSQRLIDIGELREGVPTDSIIGERLRAIAKMRASHVKVNVDALQQMSLAKEVPKLGLAIPGFVVGFSMLLGLLGTVIGLALMVQDIGQQLPADLQDVSLDSWSESIKGIKEVLGGMRTAFSATLAGLFCSICAAAVNLWLGHAQSEFFEKLERFTIEELLPATVPAVEDENLLEQISLQLETSFGRLNEIASQNAQTLKDLNAIEKAFLLIVGNVQEMAKNGAAASAQGVAGELTGVIGELTRVNRSMASLTESLPRMLELMRESRQGGGTFERAPQGAERRPLSYFSAVPSDVSHAPAPGGAGQMLMSHKAIIAAGGLFVLLVIIFVLSI